MNSTLPVIPETVTISPTRIGRSRRRMIPQTKFETISCKPKPRPTPRAASTTPDLFEAQVDRGEAGEQADAEHEVAAEGHNRKADARIVTHPREDDECEQGADASRAPGSGRGQGRTWRSRPPGPAGRGVDVPEGAGEPMNRKRAQSTSQLPGGSVARPRTGVR